MTKESLCKTCKHLIKSIDVGNYCTYACFKNRITLAYSMPITTACISYEEVDN